MLKQQNDDSLEELQFYTPLSLDLVSAIAGDRALTEPENIIIAAMKKDRGVRFFSDLLYALTHRYFSPSVSECLWDKILQHKYEMSNIMKRNIRIAVASLDYLSNLTTELPSAILSDEAYITDLISLSVHDGLTGLFNHSSCYKKLDVELKRLARYKTPVSILLADVDNFKQVNDVFGHQTGDNVLELIGKIFMKEVRESDICFRYGGDEFVVIMPMTKAAEARALAERLQNRIALSLFDGRAVTMSIGVASCEETAISSQEFITRADTALYCAKRNGKNRVEMNL
jgi:diguanylate cyclase (GGDEF)-like protein